MPIPKPNLNEKQSEFVSRCISSISGEYNDNKQAAAVCFTTWKEHKKKNRNDNAENHIKRDISIILDNTNESNFRLDEDTGFLYCDASLTRCGIFDYLDDNGNLVREFRPEEEVFSKDSLNSLKLKPITDQHPNSLVNTDNIKELQVGMIGSDIKREDVYVKAQIVITDKDMVETIQNRRKYGLTNELSCGYTCELERKDGIYGEEGHYDCIQRRIKYNHVSIVDKGRAGNKVRILDSDDKNKEEKMSEKALVMFTRKAVNLDSFKMDSISVSIPQEVLDTVATLSTKIDEAIELVQKSDEQLSTLKNDNAELVKKVDALQGKFDEAAKTIETQKNDIAELSNINSPRVVAMFSEKQSVCDIAAKLEIDTNGKDIKTIKTDCIKHFNKDIDLENRSDSYIDGRFDTICENITENIKKSNADNLGVFIENSKQASGAVKLSPREEFLKKDAEVRKVK
jgi:hypothetical protein